MAWFIFAARGVETPEVTTLEVKLKVSAVELL